MPASAVASTRGARCLSAAQVAHDARRFAEWSFHQAFIEDVDWSDIPERFMPWIQNIFAVDGQLPKMWKDQKYLLKQSVQFQKFMFNVCSKDPDLFAKEGTNMEDETTEKFHDNITTVINIWNRLHDLRKSGRHVTYSDYSGIFQQLCSVAIVQSDLRPNCMIALPAPIEPIPVTSSLSDSAKKLKCSASIFIPSKHIGELSSSAKSPYKQLNAHPSIMEKRSGIKPPFWLQVTPLWNPIPPSSFEFASCFMHGSRASQEEARRLTKMATTAALRQLRSLCISSPVYGLAWHETRVTADIAWCTDFSNKFPKIHSTSYKNAATKSWDISKQKDILRVFLILRNIDRWTVNQFHDEICRGVGTMRDRVMAGEEKITPWRVATGAVSSRKRACPSSDAEDDVEAADRPKRKRSAAFLLQSGRGRKRRAK
ncbi:hypothetical protein WOLCODRAFT_135292 [Wolfiporia cocos MD-104 SS10]|uniref:Uncharacterized protein n=1 Tax=Wolfiporia cocos (strain MD-104) TaxID=742152 RepID=A0A2H3J1S5_WOLCO|nr:hypothetical protein WOLCODRAFT_135292 [Wolfiporia cocos MD-104 SS10]